jgi:hypothetical protein
VITTIVSVIFLAVGTGAPATPRQGASAVELVQKMLNHYADARTASGTIVLAQSAQNVTVKVTTKLAFERSSSRILIDQLKEGSEPRRLLTVSDGNVFRYNKPDWVIGAEAFTEFVTQHGKTQSVQDIYAAARPALEDQNAMMDIAIARPDDLRTIMGKWATMKVHSRVKIDGVDVTAVVGDYKNYPTERVSGSFEAYIDDSFNFVRYVVKQNFAVPDQGGAAAPAQPIAVTSIWNSDLKLDGAVSDTLFKVPNK